MAQYTSIVYIEQEMRRTVSPFPFGKPQSVLTSFYDVSTMLTPGLLELF
jgi:hypothetical protein